MIYNMLLRRHLVTTNGRLAGAYGGHDDQATEEARLQL